VYFPIVWLRTMYNDVCEIGRWVVKDNQGEVIQRFNTQAKAIDFANRAQKTQQAIVLIDITHSEVQLIEHTAREEKVS
jgi:Uncharacterized protein conserved in bacteria (DUF2188)